MSKKPEAKPQDDDAIRPRKGAKVLSWVLFGMLAASLMGFGVENYGGGITTIGKVGDREIDANEYARTLNGQINQIQRQFGTSLPFDQLQALGIDRQALEQVVTANALAGEAAAIGLSAGDETVAREITARKDFQGVSGGFDKETYRAVLDQNRLTVSDFEQTVREDVARTLLQGAVMGGVMAPDAAVDTLHKWQGEQRTLAFLPLTEADLPVPLTEPDTAAVQAHYDANIATYTRPEAKRIRYVALTPEVAAKDIPVDEAAVRALYDARLDQYQIPEKRLVERLVYPDDAAATAAKARLDAGESFETLVADRKLALSDIDMGDVSKAELGAAGEAVFGLAEPGVVGPLPSDLGPALYRMNAILAAQDTAFDAVKAELETEWRQNEGARAVGDRVEAIDDLLAGGGTLEDMAKELGLTVEATDYASGADDNVALALNPTFQKSAEALTADAFLEALVLEDGSLMAMEFVETVPPTAIALDQIRDRVIADARAAALNQALTARAEAIQTELAAGKTLADFGTPTTASITRDQNLTGQNVNLTQKGFEMAAGDTILWSNDGTIGLLHLNEIIPAPATGATADEAKKALVEEYRASIAGDLFALYSKALTDKAGLQLDQSAINAVHTSLMQN